MSENWHDSATEFSADSLAGTVGNSVVYSTDDVSLNVKATLDETTRDVIDANGHAIIYTSTDFLIRAKRLKFNGVLFKPAKEHRITMVVGNVTNTYTVLPIPGGTCYRPEDAHGFTYRVHTKLTGSV